MPEPPMISDNRKLSYRKAKWKARVSTVLADAKHQYLRARVEDKSQDMSDFYVAAGRILTLGCLGVRILEDVAAACMAERTRHDVAWTCLTLQRLSAAMYAVAERNNWPVRQFPTFTSNVLHEYEHGGVHEEEETDE